MTKISVMFMMFAFALPALARSKMSEEDVKRCTAVEFSRREYNIALFLSGDERFAARHAWVPKDNSPECRQFRGEPQLKK